VAARLASNGETETRPGIGVDSKGGAVIDPTKNVLDLVRAGQDYQNAQRDALKELLTEKVEGLKDLIKILSESIVAYQNAQRDAETKRIDQLAQTRQEFQNTIRDMLAESVRTTSNLVSTQLVQIQATFDTRVTKLEAGAFTQAGKSSVQDPQTADALSKMANSIASTSNATSDAIARLTVTLASMKESESGLGGQRKGSSDANAHLMAWIIAIAGVASAVVAIIGAVMFRH
jgi:hypothetical protein